MWDSLALLAGEVDRLLGLDEPFVTGEDLIAALFRVFAFYGLGAQQSSYGRTSKLSPEFTVGSRDTLLTAAPDMMLPSYLEVQKNQNVFNSWRYVYAVDSASLEEARRMGQIRCCFEREEDGFHLRLSYDPDGTLLHRLRYYTDPIIPGAKDDPLPLPERFAPMFASRAVPFVASSAMNLSAKLEEKDQLNTAQLAAISAAIGLASSEVADWKPLWEAEIKSNRNPIGRDRRPVLSRGMGGRRTYNG